MALGLNKAMSEDMLEWLTAIGTPAAPASAYWIQWHDNVGDPGVAGTSNISTALPNRDQMDGTTSYFSSGTADDGEVENTNAGESAAAGGSETIAYFSVWSLVTGGTFLFSGDLASPQAVTSGGKLTYIAGALTVSITGAA